MAKSCKNIICGKLVKWLDRGRCKVCASYHRKHNIDRTFIDMRKTKPKKKIIKSSPVKYICINCETIEFRRNGFNNPKCKRCQINDNSKRYRELHPEKRKQITKNYIATHRVAYLAALKRARDKRRSTIKGKIDHRMSANMYYALRVNKAGKSWKEMVPYSIDELREHLHKLFTDGMSWELLMRGEIEIDHITPKAAFTYSSPDDTEFKKCWALNNLQPLWKIDNKRKSAKLDWELNRV